MNEQMSGKGGGRSQASMDARAASFNPSHAAYNPTSASRMLI
jgi:hypothetical protein